LTTPAEAAYRAIGYVVMALIAIISLFPFIWALVSSFKTNQQILSSAFSMPTAFDFTGYAVAIKIANIPNRFMNSVIISSISTAVAVTLFAMSSYAFARFNFKGKGALFGLLICSLLIPTNAMIQPVFATIKFAGLYDTRTALVLVYIAFRLPMCLFILRSYFLGLPREIEEAAYVEGAGFFNTFVRIVLPMSKPALASAAVLSFIDSWNELLYAMMLTSREAIRTLPLAMKHFVSQFSFNYTAMFAAMVMCMLPTVVMYIVLQEQIMESMIAGSLKG
jgi:raffinose/stachyose/melibiose transport system permease protein